MVKNKYWGTFLCAFIYASYAGLSYSATVELTPNELYLLREKQKFENEINTETTLQNEALEKKEIESKSELFTIPEEKDCFYLNRWDIKATLSNDETSVVEGVAKTALNKVVRQEQLTMRCVGAKGLQAIINQLQETILKHGYITTRIGIEEQDLAQGTVHLLLIPGLINHIDLKNKTQLPATIKKSVFTIHRGKVLRVRDIEQDNENIRKIYGNETELQILPAEQSSKEPVGLSDIDIYLPEYKKIGGALKLDDAGSGATGEYLLTGDLQINHPLFFLDNLKFSFTSSYDHINDRYGRYENWRIFYNIPIKRFNLNMSYIEGKYAQDLQGLTLPILYKGTSKNAVLGASYTLYRDSIYRTTIGYKFLHRQSRNFIEDYEVGVQRRRTSAGEINLEQYANWKNGNSLVAFLTYRKGLGVMGALPAVEELFDEGVSRPKILQGYLNFRVPIKAKQHFLTYDASAFGQWSHQPLPSVDRFYIGGRYSVRGIHDINGLVGDNGFYLQQDLSLHTLHPAFKPYVGFDVGSISGPNRSYGYRELMGAVIGAKGQYRNFYYELFYGRPIKAPWYFERDVTSGFTVGLMF